LFVSRNHFFVRAMAFAALSLALLAGSALPGSAGTFASNQGSLEELFQHPGAPSRSAPTSGFTDLKALGGLAYPTAAQFSSDGRIFVAEKRGLIKVFDGLGNPTPTVFADLRPQVYDFADRGLLGLALDPKFPAKPYVYALYTMDGPKGSTPPVYHDNCSDPQQACVAAARLSRFTEVSHDVAGPEQVLIEGWCQQFPSHSIGTLAFGPDGALYVGGGDGASFTFADYGQYNGSPCHDPGGSHPTPPTAEGGALRAQDLRHIGDRTTQDGAILRVNRKGRALPDNPLYGGTDRTDDPVISEGLRNPFRFTFRPGSSEIYVGDVGWNTWEEIDVVTNPIDPQVRDFGWPCYEGSAPEPDYQSLGLNICDGLYNEPGAVTAPLFAYNHYSQIVPGEDCPLQFGSVISAISFYAGGSYPARYNGALFFGDHSRRCFWVMYPGAGGTPDPSTVQTFETAAHYPVDLKVGPGGDLFYVDFDEGMIRRIQFTPKG